MAPPRKKRSELSKSAKYYRDNPKARKKKAATDKKVNSRSDQKSKRAELAKKNRAADKRGVDRRGKDFDHATNRYVKSSTNRGRSNGTAGDKRARGKKK